jgi:hypothetical protein
MGLDMYARTIDAKLVPEGQEIDVPLTELALAAVGFVNLSDEEFDALSKAERTAYWDKQEAAQEICNTKGIYDTEFAYWRKFNALHGWMESLYREKGGTDTFNCTNVRLQEADLARLEADAQAMRLKPTTGFFFGSQHPFGDEERDEVLEFVAKARAAIAHGKAVFYSSWW